MIIIGDPNGKCAYIDAEHALDNKYCMANGVDTKKLLLAQPESGEQAFAIIEALVKTGMIDLIVVDSVADIIKKATPIVQEYKKEQQDEIKTLDQWNANLKKKKSRP